MPNVTGKDEVKSSLDDYLDKFRNCFPKDTRLEIISYNEIIVRNVIGLPGYQLMIAGPREKTGYIAELPEDVVSIIIPSQCKKYQRSPGVHLIYPKDHIELAILQAQRMGNRLLPNSEPEVSMDTIVVWLDDYVYWKQARTTMGTVEGYGNIFLERVNFGNNDNYRPIAYRTKERYPGKEAVVINTRKTIDEAPKTIAELVRSLHVNNRG